MDSTGLVEAFLRRVEQRRLRRLTAELWKFAEALDGWLHDLLAHPRTDWRERFESFLAGQEAEGRIPTPESKQSLLGYLTWWATTIGLAPGAETTADGYPKVFGPLAGLLEEEIRSRSLVTAPPLVPELPPVPDWKPRIVEIKQIKGFWGHYDELVASGKYDPGSLERAFYGFLRTIFPSSEPSTRITFDDGTVLILLGGGPDSGALADQAAVILTVGGAAVSKATLKEALVAFFKGLGRETGESVADNVVQEVTGLPVGPSSLVPKKGKSRTPQSSRVPAPRFWTRTVTFQGLKVYQRSDLIDPKRLDRRGRSNLQRMRTGRAPIGPDGESLELHHFLQSADSPVAEVTQTFHQQRSRTMHINPQSIPSGIDRQSFRLWREQYWINRAKDFEGKS